eukprot:1990150-Ditylum_brightwellii.AAC.1
MAVIKKEQDKAATAKPVTTSGVNIHVNRREQCWKQNCESSAASRQQQRDRISMSTEGNNTGSEIARVLLLHVSNKEIV